MTFLSKGRPAHYIPYSQGPQNVKFLNNIVLPLLLSFVGSAAVLWLPVKPEDWRLSSNRTDTVVFRLLQDPQYVRYVDFSIYHGYIVNEFRESVNYADAQIRSTTRLDILAVERDYTAKKVCDWNKAQGSDNHLATRLQLSGLKLNKGDSVEFVALTTPAGTVWIEDARANGGDSTDVNWFPRKVERQSREKPQTIYAMSPPIAILAILVMISLPFVIYHYRQMNVKKEIETKLKPSTDSTQSST